MPRRGITDPPRVRTAWLALLLAVGTCAWPLGSVAWSAQDEAAPEKHDPAGAHGPQHAGLAAPPPPLLTAASAPAVSPASDAAKAAARLPRRIARILPSTAAAAAPRPVRRSRAQTWFSRRNLEGG